MFLCRLYLQPIMPLARDWEDIKGVSLKLLTSYTVAIISGGLFPLYTQYEDIIDLRSYTHNLVIKQL